MGQFTEPYVHGSGCVIPKGYVWCGRCTRCGFIVCIQPTTEHDWLMRCNVPGSFPNDQRCDGLEVEFESPLREIVQAAYLSGGHEAVFDVLKEWKPSAVG